MHHQDTHTTLATTATTYDYLLALARAIGELVAVPEDEPCPEAVSVYVPHWYEAGGPWQLRRVGGRLEWHVARADHRPATEAGEPAALALAFREDLAGVAARMLAFDQAHPFVIDQTDWCLAAHANA